MNTVDNQSLMVKCSIVRGGTSKAIFIQKNELPENPEERDKMILAIFGSPSLRQLDGLGGADNTTSKVAIIGPSTHPDADIDYTFGQVSLVAPFVDWGGNCGNISSGVGPYAIHHGLVKITEPETVVRIHMTNTGHILQATVQVKDGKPCVDGEQIIGGVPGTSAPIIMDWKKATGCTTGKILPTGHPTDVYEMDGKKYTVSIVDGGNNVIYCRAEDFGLKGTESPDEINSHKDIIAKIEKLRGIISADLGIIKNAEDSFKLIPYQPFFCLVTDAESYDTYTGEHIDKKDVDILVRIYVMGMVVKAYPGTATVSTGVAARIKGTLISDIMGEEALKKTDLNLGHPTGTITVTSKVGGYDGIIPKMEQLSFIRTARVLMDGYTYVRKSVLK